MHSCFEQHRQRLPCGSCTSGSGTRWRKRRGGPSRPRHSSLRKVNALFLKVQIKESSIGAGERDALQQHARHPPINIFSPEYSPKENPLGEDAYSLAGRSV
ncbi:hypothetical protein CEXT_505141 [Caerostris extrusa]|uniref:Uncharacterized protein n=1 Tax=Caerostris extrusa TaxID=172846 RepID=A0AAV4PKP0_CAEEX|nr:hypothetical protein CEXT_505141 [Caerostris extrusa]